MALHASDFIKFVNAAVSPYHAVQQAMRMLESAGFKMIKEADAWNLQPGGSYYFTRNQSSIVAMRVGGKFTAGNGFNIVGAHTDSPVLKVKPVSVHSAGGYVQVGVEPYGGGLWHTWFDRDLTIAGRVMVKHGEDYVSRLVKIDRPILRIPTLAIHLNREVNSDGFKFNAQTHLLPVLSTAIKETLAVKDGAKHHPRLLEMLSAELQCKPEDIHDFDLNLVDTQPACIGGPMNEFVFSPRLDNLCMSFCALQGLLAAQGTDTDANVRVVALFDHEEVGSASDHGAASPIIQEVIRRVTTVIGASSSLPHDVVEVALRNSFFVSADMAHALHPNYSEKHEAHHQPAMHKGIVLKENSNQRYATSAVTSLPLRIIAQKHNIPLQEFCVRNDSACGSTIGPIVSSNTGVRTVDIGAPQLSMHSIREMCGVDDIKWGAELCQAFFEDFTEVDKRITVDAGTA